MAKPVVVQDAAAENAAISRRLENLVEQSDQISASRTQFSDQLARLTERMREAAISPRRTAAEAAAFAAMIAKIEAAAVHIRKGESKRQTLNPRRGT